MNQNALIVSHGQPSDPEVGEAEIANLAGFAAKLLPGWTVRGITLASSGGLEKAIDDLPNAVIYPLFMADGWFTQKQLPKRLSGKEKCQLPPFGSDPGLPSLASRWLRDVVGQYGWSVSDVDLVIAGHGSGKSRRVSEATRSFADQVASDIHPNSVRCGFVEEDPRLVEALSGLGPKSICLPFFATKRGHVLEDLPQAVKQSGFAGVVLDPIGLHPDVPTMIARTIANA